MPRWKEARLGECAVSDVRQLLNETRRQLRQGFTQWEQGVISGALAACPAWRLVITTTGRIDWMTRWVSAGGTIFGSEMIAAKTDVIWSRVSAFGLPYPPFDFNDNAVTISVDRARCLALGIKIGHRTPRARNFEEDVRHLSFWRNNE